MLHELEYGPFVYWFDGRNDPAHHSLNWVGVLYGYLASNIPVIVMCDIPGVGRHALVAVGAELTPREPEAQPAGNLGVRTFARDVTSFFVHDDRWGPFAQLRVFHTDSADDLPPTAGTIEYATGEARTVVITALMVPLPINVILLSEWAHLFGVGQIQTGYQIAQNARDYRGPYRTALYLSTDIKAATHNWRAEHQPAAHVLRNMPMPKWVWMTEAFGDDATVPTTEHVIARIITDSTQLQYARHKLFVAGHLDHKLIRPATMQGRG